MTDTEIVDLAEKHGWVVIPEVKDPYLISFHKIVGERPARINVWPGKMTVGTYITHPKQGKTQLFRKYVDRKLLESIFKNPRVHSQRGYR